MGHHPQAGSYRKESRGPYTDCLVPLYNQYHSVQLSALSVYSPAQPPNPLSSSYTPLVALFLFSGPISTVSLTTHNYLSGCT